MYWYQQTESIFLFFIIQYINFSKISQNIHVHAPHEYILLIQRHCVRTNHFSEHCPIYFLSMSSRLSIVFPVDTAGFKETPYLTHILGSAGDRHTCMQAKSVFVYRIANKSHLQVSQCRSRKQASVECRYNAVQYNMTLHTSLQEESISIKVWNHKRHPIPRPNGRALGVFCEHCGEIWPRYNGTALYIYAWLRLTKILSD